MKCPAGDVNRFVRTYRQAPLSAPSCRGVRGRSPRPRRDRGCVSDVCRPRGCGPGTAWDGCRRDRARRACRGSDSARRSGPHRRPGRHGGGAATMRVGSAPRARDRPDGAGCRWTAAGARLPCWRCCRRRSKRSLRTGRCPYRRPSSCGQGAVQIGARQGREAARIRGPASPRPWSKGAPYPRNGTADPILQRISRITATARRSCSAAIRDAGTGQPVASTAGASNRRVDPRPAMSATVSSRSTA